MLISLTIVWFVALLAGMIRPQWVRVRGAFRWSVVMFVGLLVCSMDLPMLPGLGRAASALFVTGIVSLLLSVSTWATQTIQELSSASDRAVRATPDNAAPRDIPKRDPSEAQEHRES